MTYFLHFLIYFPCHWHYFHKRRISWWGGYWFIFESCFWGQSWWCLCWFWVSCLLWTCWTVSICFIYREIGRSRGSFIFYLRVVMTVDVICCFCRSCIRCCGWGEQVRHRKNLLTEWGFLFIAFLLIYWCYFFRFEGSWTDICEFMRWGGGWSSWFILDWIALVYFWRRWLWRCLWVCWWVEWQWCDRWRCGEEVLICYVYFCLFLRILSFVEFE